MRHRHHQTASVPAFCWSIGPSKSVADLHRRTGYCHTRSQADRQPVWQLLRTPLRLMKAIRVNKGATTACRRLSGQSSLFVVQTLPKSLTADTVRTALAEINDWWNARRRGKCRCTNAIFSAALRPIRDAHRSSNSAHCPQWLPSIVAAKPVHSSATPDQCQVFARQLSIPATCSSSLGIVVSKTGRSRRSVFDRMKGA